MGKRQDIYALAKSELLASTGIVHVSQEVAENSFAWKENRFPGVRLIDGIEIKERFAYPGSTEQLDMKSEFSLEFMGFVRSYNKSSTEIIDNQNQLLVDVETAIANSTLLDDITADIVPNDQVTDKGNLEGMGWISGGFNITYYYNHTAP